MTDIPRLRLIDCQGERPPLMSTLEAIAGITPELAEMRATARRARRARNIIADGFCDLIEADGLDGAHAWLRTLLDGQEGKAS